MNIEGAGYPAADVHTAELSLRSSRQLAYSSQIHEFSAIDEIELHELGVVASACLPS
jgi:hypothetical protein